MPRIRPRIVSVDPRAPNPEQLAEAIRMLISGELIGFPTDTVYGVGSVPEEKPVEKLLEAKMREPSRGAVLLIDGPQRLDALVLSVSAGARALLKRFWPGPLTLVFAAAPKVLPALAPKGKVAVRLPDHAVVRLLVQGLDAPLASSSANASGEDDPLSAEEVVRGLREKVALVLDSGHPPLGIPSTVVDVTRDPPEILRKGALGLETLRAGGLEIRSQHPFDVLIVCTGNSCRSPMAGVLLESGFPAELADKVRVRSAGVACIDGAPVTEYARQVAGEHGLDLREHRSKHLTPKMVGEADLVLVMEPYHRDEITRRFPGAAAKVHFLRGFGSEAPDSERVIHDPIGQSLRTYRECFRQIEESMPEILAEIVGRVGENP
jgi:tRNA threonylcarbamoyl adenosine modification protein (Sua5/YciO/YrdC/YwlC family)